MEGSNVDPTLERARMLTQVASQAAEDVAMEMKRFLANAEQRRKQIQQTLHPPSPPKPIPDPGPGPWEVAVIQGSALVTTKGDLRRVLKRGMVVDINGREYQIKRNGELSSQRFELAGDYDANTDFHATLSFPGQVDHAKAQSPVRNPQSSARPPQVRQAIPGAEPQPQLQLQRQELVTSANNTGSLVPRSRRFLTKEELPEALSRAAPENRSQNGHTPSKQRSNSASMRPTRPPLRKKSSNMTSEQSSGVTATTSTSPLKNMDLAPRTAAEAEAFRRMKQLQEEQRAREAEEKRVMSERAAAEGQKQAKKRAKLIMQKLHEKRDLEQKLQQPHLRHRPHAVLSAGTDHSSREIDCLSDGESATLLQEQAEHAERARQKALLRVHQRKEDEEVQRRRQEELMQRQEQERQERSKALAERHQFIAKRRVAQRARQLKEQQQVEELLQQRAAEERERAEEERKATAEMRAMEVANDTRRRIQRREREKLRKEQMEQNRIEQLLHDFESSNRRKYLSYLHYDKHPEDSSVQSQSQHTRASEHRRPSSMRASPLPPLMEPENPMLRTHSEQKQRPRRTTSRGSMSGTKPATRQFLPHISSMETSDPRHAGQGGDVFQVQQAEHESDQGSVVSDDSIGLGSNRGNPHAQDDQFSTVSSMTGFSGLKTHTSGPKVPRKKPVRPIWRMLEPIPIKPFVEVPKKDDFSNMRNYASQGSPTAAP